MRQLLTCIFILLAAAVHAQQNKVDTFSTDTINLRGIIFTADGKPAQKILIASKQRDLRYRHYSITTITDTGGNFVINGAKPQDTLSIWNPNYPATTYMNKGSRYMVIYLPIEKVYDINEQNPVMVTAKRRYPKIIPVFKWEEDHTIIDGVEVSPQFPGGDKKLFDYLQQRLNYPPRAITNNIEGTVQIAFTVVRDGSLTNFRVVKGIGYGCDEEALGVMKQSPKWRPGIVTGRPVTANETISIEFKLTDK